MRIELYLSNKICTFFLPQIVSGSYSFDANAKEEIKLVNIEARNNKWYLYSTSDIKILDKNGNEIKEIALVFDSYYIIKRNKQNFLIFTSRLFLKNLTAFSYNTSLNITLGYSSNCNMLYNCPYLNGLEVNFRFDNAKLILTNNLKSNIYVNCLALNEVNYYIKNGDVVDIYGLRLVFFANYILISDPKTNLIMNNLTVLKQLEMPESEKIINLNLPDYDLYKASDYFSKAPRIRRTIETKKVKFAAVPSREKSNDMPLILVIGPMLTMAMMSSVMTINNVNRLVNHETTIAKCWPTFLMSGAMLLSTILWPTLTKKYNKKMRKKKNAEIFTKYDDYLAKKREELQREYNLQKEIIEENLININDCLKIIANRNINFWDKRIDQNDFLVLRIGIGNEKLDVEIDYEESEFKLETDELIERADKLVKEYEYIINVPLGYSFYENYVTAIMGIEEKKYNFINNMIVQLLAFYSYDDLKIVMITNEENKDKYNYIKYLNHNFSNSKNFRFFSSNSDSLKNLVDYLTNELSLRINDYQNNQLSIKPYYFIIVDGYDSVRKYDFFKNIPEIGVNLGFSIVILENYLSKLPSKCNNFISLGDRKSGVLKNSYEKQEQKVFYDEINYNIDMLKIANVVSNIPIEFEEGMKSLPQMISFLEMENVGKVEQLNITNRWNTNDSTQTLKAEIGVDESGNLMYLDLHEKAHGPHGLVAGMTGSGKSEFIITYILSMCINYSPDDVSFILIDYKGGGLAFAFENQATGMRLPHLSGTITNLDKAEMDRTLVSIDSEVKRRQKVFNEARDLLGESTIDIYKYQRHYHEGRLKEPISHLFIVCDEFAELKSQQPDFMDNLISVARIGRSLGVHLILATQKPSGVVNEQIWSNSKFKICLKVQDTSDSKEMIRRPDAASLKETGRFYLQVGYDEYFALGQSAWCGAKYIPTDRIIKQIDKSINFIDENGLFIKSIQAGSNNKKSAQGEQLSNILNSIINCAKEMNKFAMRLWLENIPPIITVDELKDEYSDELKNGLKAIIGKYDAPESQEQGLLMYDFLKQGNTVIYGSNGEEREMVLHSLIFSSCLLNSSNDFNLYILDYGSENLTKYGKFNHVGGVVVTGEDERCENLFKMIKETIATRKKILVDSGYDFETYNKKSEKKIFTMVIVLNAYDTFIDFYPKAGDEIESIIRECARYGVIFIITCDNMASLGRRIAQSFTNIYCMHMSDTSIYYNIFGGKNKLYPRDIFGRGLGKINGVHEFQSASLVDEGEDLNSYLLEKIDFINSLNPQIATSIRELPEIIYPDTLVTDNMTLSMVPIGISRAKLTTINYDFTNSAATTIAALKLNNINDFMISLLYVLKNIKNLCTIFIDLQQLLIDAKNYVNSYFDTDFDEVFKTVLEFLKTDGNNQDNLVIIYGLEKIKSFSLNMKIIEELFNNIKLQKNNHLIIADSTKNLKSLDFDKWYASLRNNLDGIWIGKGFYDQTTFKVTHLVKEMSFDYSNNMAYYVNDSTADLIKVIQMESSDEE